MKRTIQYLAGFLVAFSLSVSSAEGGAAMSLASAQADVQPKSYSLSAAYPNPFNPSTTFTLSVRDRQQVEVNIYNMLGHLVAELFEGTMQAGESRTFTFNAGELPSGIYFYRVTGEHFTAARQITLIK